ncbi:MAG: pilus assembly FimT family protein, partial [Gammaproteobacteria bacterium]
YQDMIERNRLKEAVEGLKSDLQWARAESIKKSCDIDTSFTTGGAWSYQITIPATPANTPCAIQQFYHGCIAAITDAGVANCTIKTVGNTQYPGITMASTTFGGGTNSFDFRRGTASPAGNVRLQSANYDVKAVVAPVGRVKICNINGVPGLLGYEDC